MSTPKRKATRRHKRPSKARLDQMVEEAIVDCYNESEQATGLYTMIENNLRCRSRRRSSECRSPWSALT